MNFRDHRIKGRLRKQLNLVYWLAVCIPVLIIGIYLVASTRNLLYRQDYASLESDNLRVRSIMVDATNMIDTIGNALLGDEELQKVINKTYATSQEAYEAYRYYDTFNEYKDNFTVISRIELYTDSKTEYVSFKTATEEIKQQTWYQKAISTPQPVWVVVQTKSATKAIINELRFVLRVPIIKTGKYAVLVIVVSNNHLKSRINNNILKSDIAVNQDIIFYSESGKRGQRLEAGINYEEDYFHYSGKTTYGGKEVLMQISTMIPIYSSDKIYIVTSDATAIPYIRSITIFCSIIVILSIFVPFVVITIYTRTLSNRILILRRVMHQASLGDYHITEKFYGNDEITDVFTDLQKMIVSITKMDEEIYSAKIKEEQLFSHQQRIKYEMLASQINPHFLYNTLETIRMKALNVQDKEVANAIKLLGKSMRHVLDNSLRTVSLESEIQYIRVYLEIQHIRFGDRLRYQIHIAEEMDGKHYFILPLLLQPIVENAVSHGLETQTGVGDLVIDIGYEDDMLMICVKDNGMGMTEEELNLLITRMKKEELSTGESIGLHNIYQRIRLFYKEPYGVEITSTLNSGTEVRVYLPKTSAESVDLNETLYNRV